MKNLAGNDQADRIILEELYLANIPTVKVDKHDSEVPYSYIGKIGSWTFKRAWYYKKNKLFNLNKYKKIKKCYKHKKY